MASTTVDHATFRSKMSDKKIGTLVHCLPFANVKVACSFFTAILTATTTFPDAERYRKAYTSLADENGNLSLESLASLMGCDMNEAEVTAQHRHNVV